MSIFLRRAAVHVLTAVTGAARALLGRKGLPAQPLFRSFGLYRGIYIGGIAMKQSTGWEMHPDGDEVLTLLSGQFDIVLDEGGVERTIALAPGQGALVPRGVWHRMVIKVPGELLFLTPGDTTEHRPL
ncbi:mannose-6-phosphate isomerase-like protein (cupin superfamily) [Sphingopyxis sp. OAS728]|uniref:cupin domain-containing protein n=1 Tax=Sphingopyxis sp. OAS728 TaxID=2663823 RepID=UPI00178A4AC2|nr:cupin domain-containing protein [Sphingopyxis sp. OAS728]MBE1528523.1 mannose-6-phosphate isomerase-like protein (cupin superfamily) [Sphingopyxis sp. OAS728]